jgi:hypothetical protein
MRAIPLPSSGQAEDVKLGADVERKLLFWCSRNGLLGLLPHQSSFAVIEHKGRERWWTYLLRDADGWASWMESERSYRECGSTPPNAGGSHVTLHPFLGSVEIEPLVAAWGDYFPTEDLEDWAAPLVPLTDLFWDSYAEPVGEFVAAGYRLANMLSHIQDRDEGSREMATRALGQLTAPTTLVLEPKPRRRFSPTWRSPSLLATLGMMATQDLLHESEIATCECGSMFTASYPGAKYCSPLHRHRYGKARQRRRKPVKRTRR